MRRWVVGLFMVACSSHPDEGTVVKHGPGVKGLPGGTEGVSAEHVVPISGGTLLVAKDGVTAVAADPDRDRVFLANLSSGEVREVVLEPGDEPGRAVEDDQQRVHVALRRGGAVVSIDLNSGAVVQRTPVCAAPRGVAYDPLSGVVHVACQTGELVSLVGGQVARRVDLGRDLRDVVVDQDRLFVSRFRTAELLVVDSEGKLVRSVFPKDKQGFEGLTESSVAWRLLASESGPLMLHQRGQIGEVGVQPGGYNGGPGGFSPCGSIVSQTVSTVDPDGLGGGISRPSIPFMAGPADMALSADGTRLTLVTTGNSWGEGTLPMVITVPVNPGEPAAPDPCVPASGEQTEGEPTAVAFDGAGRVVVQSREPATLDIIGGPTIVLSQDSRADTGLALFHMNSGNGLACASCHPEGGDDARTWLFSGIGPRRTQSLGGGVMDRAPFHWNGDLDNFQALVQEVFVSRMSGPKPNSPQTTRFARFLDSIPSPPVRIDDPAAVQRGRQLFESVEVGCATCHSGSALTDNSAADVGTGGPFQVPSLIGISSRAPFMHDGCAATLNDRFGPCGGNRHGDTDQLSEAALSDLVAYLESL